MTKTAERPNSYSVVIRVPPQAVMFFVFVVDGMSCLSFDYPVVRDENGNKFHVFQAKPPQATQDKILTHLNLVNMKDEVDEEETVANNFSSGHSWSPMSPNSIRRDVRQ